MTRLTKPYMSFCDHLPIFNTENIHPITRSWCTSGIPMFELSFKVGKFKITTSIWTSFSFLPLKYLVVTWFFICQWNTLRKSMSLGRSPASLSDWDRTKSELRCCLASVESVTISTTFDFTGIKIICTLYFETREVPWFHRVRRQIMIPFQNVWWPKLIIRVPFVNRARIIKNKDSRIGDYRLTDSIHLGIHINGELWWTKEWCIWMEID